jgi:hypothetical protein
VKVDDAASGIATEALPEVLAGIDREARRCLLVERAKADKVRPFAFELPSLFLRVVQQRIGGDDVFS